MCPSVSYYCIGITWVLGVEQLVAYRSDQPQPDSNLLQSPAHIYMELRCSAQERPSHYKLSTDENADSNLTQNVDSKQIVHIC